jgi:hypothetical protein
MPKVMSRIKANMPAKGVGNLSDVGLAYSKVRRPVLSKVAAVQEAHPPNLGETLAGGFFGKLHGYYDDKADKVTTLLHTFGKPEEVVGTNIHENVHALQQRTVPTAERGYVPSGADYKLYQEQPIEAQAFNYGNYAAEEAVPFFRALAQTVATPEKFPDANAPLAFDEAKARDIYARTLIANLQKQMEAEVASYSTPGIRNAVMESYAHRYWNAINHFNENLAKAREWTAQQNRPMNMGEAKFVMGSPVAERAPGSITPFNAYLKSLGYEGYTQYGTPQFLDLNRSLAPVLEGKPGDPAYDTFIRLFQAEKAKQRVTDSGTAPPEVSWTSVSTGTAEKPKLQYSLRRPARQQAEWYNALPEEIRAKADEIRNKGKK